MTRSVRSSTHVRFLVSALLAPATLASGAPAEAAEADSGRYYFYRALPYGSESLVHPLRIIINGGFGITSFDNRDSRLAATDYRTGLSNVWMNLSHPIAAIEATGWADFIHREVLPASLRTDKAHYWPNYTLHVVGGGMSYRLAAEWFHFHGYPMPRTLSIASMAAYHLVNEVVENDDFTGWSTDAVADIYVFDPLGILLFSLDPVARFFAQTLHMTEWSYQAAIDPRTGALHNHGQNFALKYGIGRSRWSVFYHLGTHDELGLSYTKENGDAFSCGSAASRPGFCSRSAAIGRSPPASSSAPRRSYRWGWRRASDHVPPTGPRGRDFALRSHACGCTRPRARRRSMPRRARVGAPPPCTRRW